MTHQTVFDAISRVQHDEDFTPTNRKDFHPTSERPGSPEKVKILAKRAALGQPLWHEHDFNCGGSDSFSGVSGPGIKTCRLAMTQWRKIARD